MLLANEATYRKLSTFQSVEELNEAIKAHRQAHNLSDTERVVLDVISRYSCKYPGLSFLSKNKIAEAVGKVRRTVIRVCQRLEALGIIKQYETKRDGGDRRQSTNVIVILTAQLAKEDEVTPGMSRHKAPSKNNYNNTYKDTPISTNEIIKRGLKHAIPAPIYSALAPFFDGQTLYDTYGILLRAKASVDRNITLEDYGQAFVQAFKSVIWHLKRGKIGKLNAYLYASWRKVATEIKQAQVMRSHGVLGYDWLAD